MILTGARKEESYDSVDAYLTYLGEGLRMIPAAKRFCVQAEIMNMVTKKIEECKKS